MSKEVSINSYSKLVNDIQSIYEHAQQEVVKAYWKIGKLIAEADKKSEYGDQLIDDLSRDLTKIYGAGVSPTNLRSMRKFYIAYPNQQTSADLTWSHYQHLARIDDPEIRQDLEKKAVTDNLSSRDLLELIKKEAPKAEEQAHQTAEEHHDLFSEEPAKTRTTHKLKESRGTLGLIRIAESRSATLPKKLLLDLGFHMYHEYTSAVRFKPDDIVTTREDATLIPVRIAPHELYTYQAHLEKVIDGDTIWAYINLGFGKWTRQKLRLRGINTPELVSTAGQRARIFVENRLKPLQYFVVKTYTSDKYDRYLTDIFYTKGARSAERIAERGTFLNQELLDHNVAEAM